MTPAVNDFDRARVSVVSALRQKYSGQNLQISTSRLPDEDTILVSLRNKKDSMELRVDISTLVRDPDSALEDVLDEIDSWLGIE